MKNAKKRNPDVTASLDSDSRTSGKTKVAHKFPQVDEYEITGILGQGGMGTVYRAIQTKLNRSVALKVLHAVIATASPTAVARFRREASSAARLHHTNIVPIYDYGECADGYFYAMELISGQPLDALIHRFMSNNAVSASPAQLAQLLRTHTSGVISVADGSSGSHSEHDLRDASSMSSRGGRGRIYFNQVAMWMANAADGLHYAHSQGIIHRDIKPANLMLSTDGRIMIADFGLAKTTGDASVTMTGTLLGTLRYMSPEQAMARRVRMDHRTDIYSLGATMYELLCFQPVFGSSDDKELLGDIISREAPPPRKTNPRIPEELETICLKCLEKAPSARYDDAGELADDLRRFMNDLPLLAKRPGPVTRVQKFVRRHRLAVVSIAAVVLLIASSAFLARERRIRRQEEALRIKREVSTMYISGVNYADRQQWEKAFKEFNGSLRRDPQNVETLIGAAWAYLEHDKALPNEVILDSLKHAELLSRRALAVEPENVKAWSFLGVTLRRLKRYDEAIKAIHKSVQLEPEQFAAWSNLGCLYALNGDQENALRYLRQGAERAGHERNEYSAAVWRNLASMEHHLKMPEALQHVEYATECFREDGLSWLIRARILLALPNQAQADNALDAAEHADFLANETDARAKRIRALAHLRKGEFDKAVKQANKAIELGDLHTPNHLIISIAYGKRGDGIRARESLGAAKASWPQKLQNPSDAWATVKTGDLWIESAEELALLRDEAEQNSARQP